MCVSFVIWLSCHSTSIRLILAISAALSGFSSWRSRQHSAWGITYAEVFRVLGKEGVLDAEFAATLEPMARMRNRLVHHYEDIEPARVHQLIRTRLSDFDLFTRSIAQYLQKNGDGVE